MPSLRTPSLPSANRLLAAWNSADHTRISATLDHLSEEPSPLRSGADSERSDLLEGICCVMRDHLEGRCSNDDLRACLTVLRHLAASEAIA